MTDFNQTPVWRDLSDNEIYFWAHLEDEAHTASTNLQSYPLSTSIGQEERAQELKQAQRALIAHHESRAASWLADRAITGSEAQQRTLTLERSQLIADIARARLIRPAELLADYIIDNFGEEEPVDETRFDLWYWPGQNYAEAPMDEIQAAIRNEGLIPVGPRAALKYAAQVEFPSSIFEGIVIPYITETTYADPLHGDLQYKGVPVLHGFSGRHFDIQPVEPRESDNWPYHMWPRRPFLVALPQSRQEFNE